MAMTGVYGMANTRLRVSALTALAVLWQWQWQCTAASVRPTVAPRSRIASSFAAQQAPAAPAALAACARAHKLIDVSNV